MRTAKTKTPMSQEAVMNRISGMLSSVGLGFFPIEMADLVAK
jgi:hypothetical protein